MSDDAIMLDRAIRHFSCFLQQMALLSPYHNCEVISTKSVDYIYSDSSDSLLNAVFLHRHFEPTVASDSLHHMSKNDGAYTIWYADDLKPAINQLLHNQQLIEAMPLICMGSALNKTYELELEDVEIRSVTTEDEYQTYINILSEGFSLTQQTTNDFKAMLSSFGEKNNIFNHYIAYLQGEPASVMTSFYHEGAMGLYCGATLDEFKKKGICGELYRFTMNEAIKAGCDLCVYQSLVPAIVDNIGNKFGFKKYGKLSRFIKAKL